MEELTITQTQSITLNLQPLLKPGIIDYYGTKININKLAPEIWNLFHKYIDNPEYTFHIGRRNADLQYALSNLINAISKGEINKVTPGNIITGPNNSITNIDKRFDENGIAARLLLDALQTYTEENPESTFNLKEDLSSRLFLNTSDLAAFKQAPLSDKLSLLSSAIMEKLNTYSTDDFDDSNWKSKQVDISSLKSLLNTINNYKNNSGSDNENLRVAISKIFGIGYTTALFSDLYPELKSENNTATELPENSETGTTANSNSDNKGDTTGLDNPPAGGLDNPPAGGLDNPVTSEDLIYKKFNNSLKGWEIKHPETTYDISYVANTIKNPIDFDLSEINFNNFPQYVKGLLEAGSMKAGTRYKVKNGSLYTVTNNDIGANNVTLTNLLNRAKDNHWLLLLENGEYYLPINENKYSYYYSWDPKAKKVYIRHTSAKDSSGNFYSLKAYTHKYNLFKKLNLGMHENGGVLKAADGAMIVNDDVDDYESQLNTLKSNNSTLNNTSNTQLIVTTNVQELKDNLYKNHYLGHAYEDIKDIDTNDLLKLGETSAWIFSNLSTLFGETTKGRVLGAGAAGLLNIGNNVAKVAQGKESVTDALSDVGGTLAMYLGTHQNHRLATNAKKSQKAFATFAKTALSIPLFKSLISSIPNGLNTLHSLYNHNFDIKGLTREEMYSLANLARDVSFVAAAVKNEKDNFNKTTANSEWRKERNNYTTAEGKVRKGIIKSRALIHPTWATPFDITHGNSFFGFYAPKSRIKTSSKNTPSGIMLSFFDNPGGKKLSGKLQKDAKIFEDKNNSSHMEISAINEKSVNENSNSPNPSTQPHNETPTPKNPSRVKQIMNAVEQGKSKLKKLTKYLQKNKKPNKDN